MLNKLWKDPVWAAVISAGIIGAIGAVGTYLLDLWPKIGAFLGSASSHAAEANQYPNWVVWLLALLALPTVGVALVLAWSVLRGSASDGPQTKYLEDNVLGLRWRWRYLSEGSLGDVHCFCPHCDFQVFPHQASAYSAVERIAFHCDSCNSDLATFDETYESLESKVRRFIQQKLRSGSWVKQ